MTTAHANPPLAAPDRYGRARLFLGITGVGAMVVLAAGALLVGLPERWYDRTDPLTTAAVLLGAILAYAILHAPLDWLGGCILPRHFNRPAPDPADFAKRWLRGVAAHAATLFAIAALLTAVGRVAGVPGTLGLVAALSILLLAVRPYHAALVAPLRRTQHHRPDTGLPETVLAADDPAFTGSIHGLVVAERSLLPQHWPDALGHDGLRLVRRRRQLAVASGLWQRGRAVALGFTWLGALLAAALVGPGDLGTAGGTLELACWFTLWSFLGLLTLPTLARRAVAELDRRLLEQDADPELLARTAQTLNAMQDGETERPAGVEAIFHPIPSLANRAADRPSPPTAYAAWDAARLTVFLSFAGLSLLGRAVHCNAGKPALWVYLPTD